MTKPKPPPPEGGLSQASIGQYYSVVQQLPEDKNQEKLLENEEEIVFSDETKTNDNNNDSNTNLNLNRTEEVTTMTKTNTGPVEETQKDSKEEEEDESEDKKTENNQGTNGTADGLDAKNKNSNNDNQESYFNNKTEEATTMGADTEVINVESGLRNHVERFHAKGATKSMRTEVEMPTQSTNGNNGEATDTVSE